jgi:transposase-like protein
MTIGVAIEILVDQSVERWQQSPLYCPHCSSARVWTRVDREDTTSHCCCTGCLSEFQVSEKRDGWDRGAELLKQAARENGQ